MFILGQGESMDTLISAPGRMLAKKKAMLQMVPRQLGQISDYKLFLQHTILKNKTDRYLQSPQLSSKLAVNLHGHLGHHTHHHLLL